MEKPNTHPKPSEEVQLNIETVTPETEKEGLANDQKNKKESNEITPPAANIGKADEDKPDEDDARAKIETLSP